MPSESCVCPAGVDLRSSVPGRLLSVHFESAPRLAFHIAFPNAQGPPVQPRNLLRPPVSATQAQL